MDNQPKENFEAARASHQLEGRWRVWEGFQGKFKKDSSYTANMGMVYPIESVQDLANLFKNTSYAKPSNFFYNINDNTVKKYLPEGHIIEVSLNSQEDGEAYKLVSRNIGKIVACFM
jgi:hypothetical protein